MIDEMTQNSLRVSTDAIAGPYLMLQVTQLGVIPGQFLPNAVSDCDPDLSKA